MELTAELENKIVDAIKERVKGMDPSQGDFKERSKSQIIRLLEKSLSKVRQMPALPSEAESDKKQLEEQIQLDLIADLDTPLSIFQSVKRVIDSEDAFYTFLGSYLSNTVLPASQEIPDYKDGNLVFIKDKNEGDFTDRNIYFYFGSKSTDDTLAALSKDQLSRILDKLGPEFKWDPTRDNDGGLYYREKIQPHIKYHYFKLDKFLIQSLKIIKRESISFDREEVVDTLIDILSEIGRNESEFYNSEEYASDYGNYAAEQVDSDTLRDIKRNLEDDITDYIEKLEDLDVDEDEIKEALKESSTEEFNVSYSRVTNSIGSFVLSNEEQCDWDDFSHDKIDNQSLPYPNSINDNIALLDTEEIKSIERQVDGMTLYIRFNPSTFSYEIERFYPNLSERSIELVVDADDFASRAKKIIKREKLKNKKSGDDEVAESSFDEYQLLKSFLVNSSEISESGKKEESKISLWLSSGKDFGKDGDVAWSQGNDLYSYRTIIAKKDNKIIFINENRYSNTTTKITRFLEVEAESQGFSVEHKPESFFNTQMVEKLPSGYKEITKDLVQKIMGDSELVEMAKSLSKKDESLAWVKIAKLGARKYFEEDRVNPQILRMAASHLKDKLGPRLLLSGYRELNKFLT